MSCNAGGGRRWSRINIGYFIIFSLKIPPSISPYGWLAIIHNKITDVTVGVLITNINISRTIYLLWWLDISLQVTEKVPQIWIKREESRRCLGRAGCDGRDPGHGRLQRGPSITASQAGHLSIMATISGRFSFWFLISAPSSMFVFTISLLRYWVSHLEVKAKDPQIRIIITFS